MYNNIHDMKKIFIIHENDEWVEPLRVHLNDLQVPYVDWHMDKVTIDTFHTPPLGVFYKEDKPSYDAMMTNQINNAINKKGRGKIQELFTATNSWTVE